MPARARHSTHPLMKFGLGRQQKLGESDTKLSMVVFTRVCRGGKGITSLPVIPVWPVGLSHVKIDIDAYNSIYKGEGDTILDVS